MKRRSLIVNSLLTSIGTALCEGATAFPASLRQSQALAKHLGVHTTVWTALADRASGILPGAIKAFCAEVASAGTYRFQFQEADGLPAQECSLSLQAEAGFSSNGLASNAVLLCSSTLAAHAGELVVLRVNGVASAGGIGLYSCDGNAGSAVLLIPAPEVPQKLLGLVFNE